MGMAVGATAVEVLDGTEGLGLGRMAAAVMAVVAHAWHANFQQLRVVAAVRFVAISAVFEYRRVVPHGWGAPRRGGGQGILLCGGLGVLRGGGWGRRRMRNGARE